MTPDRPGPIASGFAALSHWKLVLLLATTAALLGITGAMPLAPAFREAMAGTLAGDALLRNQPTQAPGLLFDLLHEKEAAFAGATRTAGWVGALGILLQTFFAGGIVAVLGRGPFSFGQFLEPARRSFWHNLKCFFLFVSLLAVALGIWLGGTYAAYRKIFEEVPPDAPVRTLALWVCAIGALLIFAVLSLLYDFARAVRRYAGIGALRGFRFARRALSGAWLRGLGLWLFWGAFGGVTVAAGFALAWEMPAVSPPGIALLLALQFGVLGLRSAVRVAAWGSYLEFLDGRAREAIAATARIRYTIAAPTPDAV